MTDYSDVIARMRERRDELMRTIDALTLEAGDLDLAAAFIEDSIPAPTPPPEPVPEPDPVPTPTPTPTPDPEPPTAYKHPLGVARFGSQTWYLRPDDPNTTQDENWPGGDPSKRQWDDDARALKITVLRHMDSACTPDSTVREWSERQIDQDNWFAYIDRNSKPGTVGISLENQIGKCNALGVDAFLTHPLLASDAYFTECAKLVKRLLDPRLRAHIELSNEVWNGPASTQLQTAIDEAAKLGNMPGSNKWYQAMAWFYMRAQAMYQCYADVFGQDVMGSKVIRTWCHGGNLDFTVQSMKNIKALQSVDMLCCAPYVSVNGDGAAETYESWKTQVNLRLDDKDKGLIMPTKRIADQFGIPYVGFYEFGSSHSKNADVFAKSSIAYDCYRYMLDTYLPLINGPACHYTLHGTWTSKSAWGLLDHQGQDIATSGKARAVRERFGK